MPIVCITLALVLDLELTTCWLIILCVWLKLYFIFERELILISDDTYFQNFVAAIFPAAFHRNQNICTFSRFENALPIMSCKFWQHIFLFIFSFLDIFTNFFSLLSKNKFSSINCLQFELIFWPLDVVYNISKTSQNKWCEKWPNMCRSDQESIF